ncbi:MAG TPA: glycosyltransferase [Candidatus Atribacteria bacterium]|nr:glycosyltransferase [Candidatus Atribacteria bacterium]
MELMKGLSKFGHEVHVICGKYKNNITPFQIFEKVWVYPLLNANPNCDEDLTLEQIIENIKVTQKLIEKIDIIVSVDRAFPIFTQKPILLILSTLSYHFSIRALLSLNYDKVIVLSRYLHNCIKHILYGTDKNTYEFCKVIPNGLNHTFYRPAAELHPVFNGYENTIKILFPHRADSRKGFKKAIDFLSYIKEQYNAYMFIPKQEFFTDNINFYNELLTYAKKLGVKDRIILHKWIPIEDLPMYFSSGDVVFNLSTLAEGFGLVVYESILCGTSVISTKCGALRDVTDELKGVWWLDHDYTMDDLISTFENAIINKNTTFQGRETIIVKYPIESMIKGYLNEIEGLVSKFSLKLYQAKNVELLPRTTKIGMPPWCYITKKENIYSDITGQVYPLKPKERDVITSCQKMGTRFLSDKDKRIIDKVLDKGILMYIPDNLGEVIR